MLDHLRQRSDEPGEPTGRDDRGRTELVGNAAAHRIDETRVAVDGPGLDRLDGRLADHVAWLHKLDTAQRRGMFEERLHADRDPGRDGTAEVLARSRDGVERRRRAHVHDDGRPAVQVDGTDSIGNTVRSDVFRVVVENRHPGADPRLDHDKWDVEPEVRHLPDR